MQHESALLVEVSVEEVEGCIVVLADYGAPITTVRLAKVRREVGLQRIVVLVAAEVHLAPDVLEERRESFVEPRLVPGAASDVVAKPMMSELVRDEVVGADVDRGSLVDEN